MPEVVEIVGYDPSWKKEFMTLANKLREVLGDLVLSVEHVGSTSVPGMAAKPVIDLDVVISSRLKLPEVIRRLASIGYTHAGNQTIPGREVFKQRDGKRHHLYVCSVDTPNLHNHLLFRDYLRAHPAAARSYGDLKKRLSVEHRYDREAYSLAKTEFVESILTVAGVEYGFDQFQPQPSSPPQGDPHA